jgi:hypothetical protein
MNDYYDPEEAADLALTHKVMTDLVPLEVFISIAEAWLLITALQLAIRHPALGEPMRQSLENIGRQFQESVVARHPEAADLLERGWDSFFDVEAGS